MPDDIETEFKLRATAPLGAAAIEAAALAAGCHSTSADSSRHLDAYLDDDRGSLAAAGFGLRLRDDRRGRRLTLKQQSFAGNGLFVRTEHEAPWPQPEPPQRAADLPPPLRDLVEPFVWRRPLQSWLQLAIDREVRELALGDARAELAIDRVHLLGPGTGRDFLEVEIEVLDDLSAWEQVAQQLTSSLPLEPALDDKPSHARDLLGLPKPSAPAAELTLEQTTATALARLAAPHLRTMAAAEVAVRLDRGPQHLHELRVALRRLRGLLRAFRAVFPAAEAEALGSALASLAQRLGALRDLDVLLGELPNALRAVPAALAQPSTAAADLLQQHRQQAHAELLAWLRSDERLAAHERLLAAFAAPAGGPLATEPLATTAPSCLAAAAQRVRRLVKGLPEELPLPQLHELRIAGKRLRYLAEALQPVVPIDDRTLRWLADLQQNLGSVCDHDVAVQRLLGWLGQLAAHPDALHLAAVVGGLATAHHRAGAKALKRAQKFLQRFRRKKVWRGFPAAADAPAQPPDDATLAP